MTVPQSLPRPPPLRGRELLGFVAFSHGWTWTFWWLAAQSGESIWQPPALHLFMVGGAGILLAGMVMTAAVHGAAGLRDLLRRTLDPRLVPVRWWPVIVVFYPAVTCVTAVIAALAGVSQPIDLGLAAARLVDPFGLIAMVGFVLVVGPLPEEIGWRGFLQDRLQTRYAALAASLSIGVAWWVWHLPLFALPGYFEAFGAETPTPLGFLANILPAAVLYAWVYLNTNRSVLAAILFHFMENFSSVFLGMAEDARPIRFVVLLAITLFVVWRWGGGTLRGTRPDSDRKPAE